MHSFYYASVFLINTIFSAYLYVLAVRLTAAFVRANYFNPAMRFIITLTQPLVAPLRKVIPNAGSLESATLVWILIIEALKVLTLTMLAIGVPGVVFIITYTLIETMKLILYTYFYAILLQAILTWVQQSYSPVGELLTQITQPIMRPLHRIIPPIGGIDITPIPALLILQFLIILIS